MIDSGKELSKHTEVGENGPALRIQGFGIYAPPTVAI